MDYKYTTEYKELLNQIEHTGSHKDARHLINKSTELMAKTKTVKSCRYPDTVLIDSIKSHQDKIKRYQEYINVSEQLIEMCQEIIDYRKETINETKEN